MAARLAPAAAGAASLCAAALCLAGSPGAAQALRGLRDLPSTTAEVPGQSVIALLDDLTSLEGLVWFEAGEARYCLTGISLVCGGALPQTDAGLVSVPLSCSGGVTGDIEVSTVIGHAGGTLPRRAAGQLSDGRSLVALFGPFRVMQGARCTDFSATTAPEESL